MRIDRQVAIGAGLIALGLVPPVAAWLESGLVSHLFGQYLLLLGGGALIGSATARRYPCGWCAAPALLAGLLALAFWLIPRWIDAALADTATNTAKVMSLVLLAGLPLGWGWRQAGGVLRGFVWANVASMLAVMGWLQLSVPSRLCNSYLQSEQTVYGRLLVAAALLMVAVAGGMALLGFRMGQKPMGGQGPDLPENRSGRQT